MIFQIKETKDLTAEELLAILIERVAVFVVEQECPYQEADEEDKTALHVCLSDETGLKAYARIINRGDCVTFGRVLVVQSARKQKLGQQLVQRVLEEIQQRFPEKPITISAQAYLRKFYESFGFKVVSDIYLEDNIPHIDMSLTI
ncbi:GNAT family N-acetyltransferase [Enterococcus sp. AZ109]|uniref:GNAT family N-acetyltransferase n=1 Tax=Enterococcus sp. AZ109 TaxID=2774634 RepID=UPI003F251A0E